MATIATYIPTGKQYVIVSGGFGANTKVCMVIIADSTGSVHWVRSEDLQIDSVDGTPIADLVPATAEAFPVINPE